MRKTFFSLASLATIFAETHTWIDEANNPNNNCNGPNQVEETIIVDEHDPTLRSLGMENLTFDWEGDLHKVIPMTDELRQAFLDKHNHYRNLAANGKLTNDPLDRAKKLGVLQYDMDLERNALEWSKKCYWGHSSWQSWSNLPYSYGENLAYTSYSGEDEQIGQGINYHKADESSLYPWVEEEFMHWNHRATDLTEYPCTVDEQCGHYTQVVSQRATRVGCAIVECERMTNAGYNSKISPYVYITCQYNEGQLYEQPYDYVENMWELPGEGCPGGQIEGMDDTWENLCKSVDDICNEPEHNSRCIGNGAECSVTDYLNGIPSDFECECTDDRSGRWCQDDGCHEKTITGKQVKVSQIIRTDGGTSGAFQLCSSEAKARSDCTKAPYKDSCIGVATYWHSASASPYWVKIRGIEEMEVAEYEGAFIHHRDCSNLDDNPVTTQAPDTVTSASEPESTCSCPAIEPVTCPSPVTTPTPAVTTTPTTIAPEPVDYVDENGIIWGGSDNLKCLEVILVQNKKEKKAGTYNCKKFKFKWTNSCDPLIETAGRRRRGTTRWGKNRITRPQLRGGDVIPTTAQWTQINDEENPSIFRLQTKSNDHGGCADKEYVLAGTGKKIMNKPKLLPYKGYKTMKEGVMFTMYDGKIATTSDFGKTTLTLGYTKKNVLMMPKLPIYG